MPRFQNCCLSGLLLGILGAAGCGQGPIAPTDPVPTVAVAPTAPGTTAASPAGKPAIPAGFYQMTFLHNGQEVTSLPVGHGVSNVLVKVHVEDSAHQPAQDGEVLYEVCRYRGVSPTTGTRGGAAPSARCADGSARWERWTSVDVNPLTGDAYAGVDVVLVPCVMGWRATYRGSRTIAPATMGPADITWVAGS
jgi:hypothetical protein